jgi:hypothetical protein
VKTNADGGCSCQSEGFDFTATGFCAVLDPNDQSYRFIEVHVHTSGWLQASSSWAACRGLARRTTAERLAKPVQESGAHTLGLQREMFV